MAYYFRRKIDEYSNKIYDGCMQISEYVKKKHIVDEQYLKNLSVSMRTVDIVKLLAELENTANILDEIKSIALLEKKRRIAESQLNEKVEKGRIKKMRMQTRQQQLKQRADPYHRFNLRPAPARLILSQPSSSQEPILPSIQHVKQEKQE